MKIGDMILVQWSDTDDTTVGIIINMDQDLVTKHVEIYADNQTGWFTSRELLQIKHGVI